MFAFRSRLLAVAFAVTAAAAFAGATLRGETRETNLDQTCAQVTWPRIPVQCLEGSDGRTVRNVAVDKPADTTIAVRFALAFGET